MTKYLLSYHGGDQPSSKEEGERTMKAWMDWMGSLGKALVEAGNPTSPGKVIGAGGKVSDGGGANAVTGWSVIEAKSLDEAVKLAKGCPQIKANGTIEVSEVVPVM